MPTYSLTLLSGGLDSTTVTAYAVGRSDHLTALTFHYGQTHGKEVECAARVASVLGVEHKLLDVAFLKDVAWYSALTSPEAFAVPKDASAIGTGIPITYVPLRNTMFLSLSAALLESKVLHAIEVEGVQPSEIVARLYMAPNAIDYSGYPDCRPEFYEQMAKTLRLGSKLGAEYGIDIEIETPIIHLSKAEIVQMAVKLSAPLDLTWSCYEGGDTPCNECDSCVLRAKGFAEAGVPDPLITLG
jgi:7-cyano-7-deazaguanine synthase